MKKRDIVLAGTVLSVLAGLLTVGYAQDTAPTFRDIDVGPVVDLPTHSEMDWQIRQSLDAVTTAELEWMYEAILDARARHAEAREMLDSSGDAIERADATPPVPPSADGLQMIASPYGSPFPIPHACNLYVIARYGSANQYFNNCRSGNSYSNSQTCQDLRAASTYWSNQYVDNCG
ncbi:MAG: hypothetical protein F4112_17070 [Holophagales bacterium]|nr:hypothetical protein [Holophagales bacterium]MYD22027.1 hypothetical protein [Holophagales bacterium]MYI34656.1 hypothetical protein [Holophagales bacterium]